MKRTACLLALLVLSCAYPAPPTVWRTPQAGIQVENHHWQDVTVYAVRSGSLKVRLGMVLSMTTRWFDLSRQVGVGWVDLRFMAALIGSRRSYTTRRVTLRPGQTARWTIEHHLPLSQLIVR